MRALALALPITILFLAPLAASLALILPGFTNTEAFAALLSHPQVWGATKLTLTTSIISTVLALLGAILIVMGRHKRLQTETGIYLALPHLALAVGLAFLIAPTGLIARLAGTILNWTSPPQWVTVQDPYGAALIAALILKETPFIVWALASLLNRDDLRRNFAGHMKVTRSLGHSQFSTWIAVLLPQLLPRIIWPLVAVFVYGATVVDMAIVIGPTQPPTLATLIWTDLNDADPVTNARGAAGVIVLSLILLCALLIATGLRRAASKPLRRLYRGAPLTRFSDGNIILTALRVIYALILLFLLTASMSGQFPYPDLLPVNFTLQGWNGLLAGPRPLFASLALALACSASAIAAAIAWMESQPDTRDRIILYACGAALCVPSLVIALGQYRLFLLSGITGTWTAMFLAHVLPVMAYVFIMLHGPYRAYDERWQSTSQGLLAPRRDFLTQVKWPMLKAPILSAAAVGFAVSIAQFIPAQLASAGRHATLPIETVTLTSGGNRALIATYALALMFLPLITFLAAGWLGKPRWELK